MNEASLWLLGIELLLLVMFAVGSSKDLAVCILTAAGVILVAVAHDVVILFAALELVSVCTWLLVYRQGTCLGNTNGSAVNLTTRHVLLSLVGSAFLLMGLSIVCCETDTTDLRVIHDESHSPLKKPKGWLAAERREAPDVKYWGTAALSPSHPSRTAVFQQAASNTMDSMHLGVVLIFAGLGMRMGAIPFALHLPHTCGSLSGMGAMMLLVGPWMAGTIALMRLIAAIWPGLECMCWPVPGLLAVVSMCYAGLAAAGEQNARRLAAYILIAQSGFVLIGAAAALSQAAGAMGGVLFYVLAISPAVIGALGILVYLGRKEGEIDVVDELAGLGRSRPWTAAAMALFLLSLAGMPPLAGFWARVAVLMPTVTVALTGGSPKSWWFAVLALAAVCSTVLTMVACARLIVVMYFRLPLATPQTRGGRTVAAAIMGCAVLTIMIGLGLLR